MKQILIVSGIVFLIAVGGYMFFGGKTDIQNVPPKNNTIVIFGDSLAQGVGSTDGHDLASVIAQKTGKAVLNRGRSGDTTRDALERVASVTDENPGVVIVILGGNDVLKKIPKEETFHNLEKMITIFHEQGSAVVLVGVRNGVVGDGRGADYEDLARNTGSAYMSDILNDVFGKRQYMSDTVHPNDAGYVIIAERLLSVITGLF